MGSALSNSDGSAALARYPHATAFSIQLGRNLVLQAFGLGMVVLMLLAVLPWAMVLVWTLCAVAAVAAEHRLLHLVADDGRRAKGAGAWAPHLRLTTTGIYAAAALALIARGGQGERFFAFALMGASMVHVLMRHYMSPRVLIVGLSPHLIVLGAVGVALTERALAAGQTLRALAPIFTIGLIALQFWSARAQLAGAWRELTGAHLAARERERAADEANRAKSQFLATMSHELRTPLNGVLGMAHALAHDRLTPVQHERVEVIRHSGEGLLVVLNDLLDLSRIENSAARVEPVEFDLEDVAREVAVTYRPLAAAKGLAFEVETLKGAAGRYLGDAAHIRRILRGLCDNAVKFTESGGVALRLEPGPAGVDFIVRDSGLGIAPADLSRLFELFFQADGSSTRRYGGAGIGLAICGGLAALMGGTIEASSALGQGSTFTLRLPLERVSASALALVVDNASQPQVPSELRVLAAEDNFVNQRVLQCLLAPAGIAPTLVENGQEALAAWESQTWDIVLMDIRMPEMDGIEATRLIRQRERQTGRARTPIIAVTANVMTHQLVEYETAGMDGVVAKPFEVVHLFEAMETALATGMSSAPMAVLH